MIHLKSGIHGFTLIELMIVIGMIGIISAFAIPIYQNYIAKTQLTASIAELNGARAQYELIVNAGSASNSTDFTVENMFLATNSNICQYAVYSPVADVSNPALECKLTNVASTLKGQSVYLNRAKDGTWSCSTTAGIDQKYKPVYCI